MIMEDDILIDNYLKGLLSKNEEQSFLERLESDADFNEKFKLEEQLFNSLNEDSWSFSENKTSEAEVYKMTLEEDDIQSLKKTLSEVNSQFNSESSKTNNRKILYYLAAASIIVLLVFQFFFNQTMSNLELYNNYVGLDDLPSFVSRSSEGDNLVEAQELFENKAYEDALVIFKSQMDISDSKADVAIYKGLSEIELAMYNDAEQTFNGLINSHLLDAEKGYWYKALLFLKQDRVEDSKQVLNKIISENLYNNNEAEELLKQID